MTAPFKDVTAVMAYIESHVSQYGFKPERMTLRGDAWASYILMVLSANKYSILPVLSPSIGHNLMGVPIFQSKEALRQEAQKVAAANTNVSENPSRGIASGIANTQASKAQVEHAARLCAESMSVAIGQPPISAMYFSNSEDLGAGNYVPVSQGSKTFIVADKPAPKLSGVVLSGQGSMDDWADNSNVYPPLEAAIKEAAAKRSQDAQMAISQQNSLSQAATSQPAQGNTADGPTWMMGVAAWQEAHYPSRSQQGQSQSAATFSAKPTGSNEHNFVGDKPIECITPKFFDPTSELRYAAVPNASSSDLRWKLQQKWRNSLTDRIEWRDVLKVEVP